VPKGWRSSGILDHNSYGGEFDKLHAYAVGEKIRNRMKKVDIGSGDTTSNCVVEGAGAATEITAARLS